MTIETRIAALVNQQRIANLQEQRSYLQRELEKERGYGGDHPKLLQLLRVDGLIRDGLGLS